MKTNSKFLVRFPNKMPKRKRSAVGPYCENIFTRYQFVCNGDYPAAMVFKYGAYLIEQGEEFTIFRLPKPKHVLLIIFQTQEVTDCKILELINATHMKCFPNSGNKKMLHYPNNRVDCINYSFRMADEMVEDCVENRVPSNDFTVLYYAEPKSDIIRHEGGAVTPQCSFVLVIAILIMFLFIFR